MAFRNNGRIQIYVVALNCLNWSIPWTCRQNLLSHQRRSSRTSFQHHCLYRLLNKSNPTKINTEAAWSDFNVQHSDIKSDGKVHVKDLYIFSSVRKSKSLYEKDLKFTFHLKFRMTLNASLHICLCSYYNYRNKYSVVSPRWHQE